MDGSDRNTRTQDLSTSLVWRTLHHGAPGLAAGAVLGLMGVSVAQALPVGGTVAPIAGNGSATISSTQNATTVVQSGSKLVLDWNSFNIGTGQSVTFVQPGSRAVAYNRINDPGLTSIDGALKANGQVWLFNSNGIAFGTHATVNVAGLLASTLQADPAAFLRGDTLTLTGRAGDGSITNAGSINADNGADGYAVLAGNSVGNAGTVDVAFGTVELAAGRVATISSYDTGLLNFALSSASGDASTSNTAAALSAVANSGSLKGGNVRLDANVAGNLFANAVNTSGIVRAQRIDTSGGTIRLVGEGGGVTDTGTLDASGSTGGDVQVVGSNVTIAGTASIDADALGAGNGGHVLVWADDLMRLDGAITARGGATAGDGGFIETSSGNAVQIHSAPNASAPNGAAGQWLIDPTNITIIHNAGTGLTISGGGLGTLSTIDDGDINTALNGGTDVTIDTSVVNTPTNAGTITENANAVISNTSGTPRSLTLNANSDVTLKGMIKDATGANRLDVFINSDGVVDTSLGTINVNGGLTIGGFTPATATGGAVTFGTTTVGGKIVVDAGGAITEAGVITTGANGSSFTAAGNIDLSTQANILFGLDTAGNNTFAPGADLLVRNVGAIQLGTTTITGKLVLISDTGGITETGVLTTGATGNSFTASAANQNIDLSTSTNAFGGTVALNTSGTGTAAIKSTSLNFGTSGIGGALTATATTGGITESGALTTGATGNSFTASSANQNIDLSTFTNAFTGTVALNTSGTGTAAIKAGALNFGASSTGGALTATATTGGITESGAITAGGNSSFTTSAANQNIDLSTSTNSFTGTVALHTSGTGTAAIKAASLNFGTSTIGGALTATATTGGISESGAITTGANGSSFTSAAGSGINLSTQANSFAGLSGGVTFTSGGDLLIRNVGAIQLGTTTVTGKLVLISDTGSITEAGAITTGATGNSFTTSAANQNIDLSTFTNAFTGTVALNTSGTGTAAIKATALNFGASTVGGALAATATTGGISESGAIAVGGNSSFTASAANQNIDLSSSTNAFTGTVALNTSGTGTAAIKATSLNFGASNVGGALTATATTGGITESGVITTGANGSSFTAAAGTIDLSTQANSLFGLGTAGNDAFTSGANLLVRNVGAIQLGTSTIAGKLVLISDAGGITETGVLTTGATGNSFTASAANQNIDLSSSTNAFTGTVALNTSGTGTAAIKATSLNFGTSTIGGALTATATTGGIAESGVITAGGNSNFTASTAGQSINLATSTNAFGGTVGLNTSGASGNAAITAAAVNFGTSNVGGTLTATAATGGITESGVITAGGASSFTASTAGQSINLATSTNVLGGPVTLATSGAGNASVTALALNLVTSNVGGGLTATATTGGITEGGVLTTGGASSFTTSGANQTIDLSTQTNAFGGTVALNTNGTGGNAKITSASLNFGASNVGGALNATATTGNISQTGAVTASAANGLLNLFTATAGSINLGTSPNVLNGTVEALAKAGSVALTSTALSNVEVFAKNNVTLSATAGNIGALSAYSSGGAITGSASGSIVVQGADAGTGTVSLGSGGTITQAVAYNAVDPAFSPSDIAIRGSSVALNAQGFGSSGNFLGVLTNSLALTDPTASNAFFAVARTDGTQLSTGSLTFNGSALPVTPGVFLNITGLPSTTGIGSPAYVTFVNSQIPYSVGGGLSSEVILANSLTPAENQSENQAGTGNLNVVIQSAPDASVSLFNIVGLCLPADQRIDEDAAAHENCTTRLLPERRSFDEILLGAADTRADARGPGL